MDMCPIVCGRLHTCTRGKPNVVWSVKLCAEVEAEEGEDVDHNKDVILDNVRETLRESLPLSAVTSTETIIHPTVGPVCLCWNHDQTDL